MFVAPFSDSKLNDRKDDKMSYNIRSDNRDTGFLPSGPHSETGWLMLQHVQLRTAG